MLIQEKIEGIRNNDERIMRQLYQQNFDKVKRYVTQNQGTEEDAKDYFQEAFLTLWRNIQLDKFFPQHEQALEAYLYRIAKNKWLDYLRTNSPTFLAADDFDLSENGEEKESREEKEAQLLAVKASFKFLGEQCKEVLMRFYFKNESMRVIAERKGWTEATAKNNKYRCLQQLRERMKK
jgi:RNA polymerase sigma factor (sigma-70 family)